jgi:ATP-dependent helicase YprA (DUF1998 family)
VGAESLLLVDEDGSPHGPKDFVLWNPPLTAEAQQVSRSWLGWFEVAGRVTDCA